MVKKIGILGICVLFMKTSLISSVKYKHLLKHTNTCPHKILTSLAPSPIPKEQEVKFKDGLEKLLKTSIKQNNIQKFHELSKTLKNKHYFSRQIIKNIVAEIIKKQDDNPEKYFDILSKLEIDWLPIISGSEIDPVMVGSPCTNKKAKSYLQKAYFKYVSKK